MTIRIIQAKVEDAADIANVHVSSWHAAYEKIVPAAVLAAQSVEKQEAFWRDALNKNTYGILVAVAPTNEIVGFVSFGPCRTRNAIGEIYAIYARPDYFRTGIGRLLWEVARQHLKDAEFHKIIALVIINNHAARSFYEHVGFRLVPNSASTFTWEGEVLDDVCYEYRFDTRSK